MDFKKMMEALHGANRMVVLTGAGVSTESDIPDFRTKGGILEQHPEYMDDMTKGCLEGRPKAFWASYWKVFSPHEMVEKRPNTLHNLLASWEDDGKDVVIYTQNIDGLHQKAGSRQVKEVHGSVRQLVCPKCKTYSDVKTYAEGEVPRCKNLRKQKPCGFILHPDAVLFGHRVRHYKEMVADVERADVLLVLGTSLNVTPVADIMKDTEVAALNRGQWRFYVSANPNREQDMYFEGVFPVTMETFVAHLKNGGDVS